MSAMFRFDSSKLRDLIKIDAPQPLDDGGGGYTTIWTEILSVFAQVTTVRVGYSQEMELAQQQQLRQMLRIILRFQPGVDQTMRIRFNDLTFGIISITNLDNRHGWQEIIVCQGQGDR
ncbi:MAG: phage head closure protein [Alphaproteobacteria bacterium]|nr:phage head closure protein [Alphaproteobacteria bacterium]